MNLQENWRRGLETVSAYWRQGLRELGAALYGAGTVAQPPEYGMLGTKLPSEVAAGRSAEPPNAHDVQHPTLADRVKAAEPAREPAAPERDQPEIERE